MRAEGVAVFVGNPREPGLVEEGEGLGPRYVSL